MLIALASIAALLIFGITHRSSPPTAAPPDGRSSGTAYLSVKDVYDNKPVVVYPGETVIVMLQKRAAADSRLQLKTKTGPDIGTVVESMRGQTNGTAGNFWQYEVNGLTPPVGADQFELHDGDVVTWSFRPAAN